MADSFQNEVPKARINLRLNLHTGGAQKKVELPLKLLTVGDFSNGRENRPLSEREKKDINKNNFGSVLAEFSPQVNLAVENTLAGDGSEENILLTIRDIKDFEPEQVARQIPQLKALCVACCATSSLTFLIMPPSAKSWNGYYATRR